MIEIDRDEERYAAYLARGGNVSALCDWDVINGVAQPRKGTDYHEIFPRNNFKNNGEARQISYSRYLCAWLCNENHINIIHGRVSARRAAPRLVERNIGLWGYDPVYDAFMRLQSALRAPLDFEFPERG